MSRESLEELRERLLRDEHAQELIRMRAFEIYKLRGGQPGGEAHDWFQAENEVLTFLIDEESRRAADLNANAPTKPSDEPKKPGKRATSKTTGASKVKASEKPASKRASKKPASSVSKPRGKGTTK